MLDNCQQEIVSLPNSRTYFLVKGLIISRKIEDRDVLNEDNTFTIQIANRKDISKYNFCLEKHTGNVISCVWRCRSMDL